MWNVKVRLRRSDILPWQVLIETLWNVKRGQGTVDVIVVGSFNRNIVECKVANLFASDSYPAVVLIETLWNVKRDCGTTLQAGCSVLIETLWNVKQFPVADEAPQFPGF